ncbi:MAG: hypothetical protein HXY34_13390 [Candidatus Thorarchaeota archaeon]|nr:hypothetical protein [Candidatus Thorarchaeota archaeon]
MLTKPYRRRHVLFQLHHAGPAVSEKQLSAAIRKSLLTLFGEVCVADSHFYLDSYDPDSGLGILQCSSSVLPDLLTAASVIRMVDQTEVSFDPRKTSGTIKSLSKYLAPQSTSGPLQPFHRQE